MVAARAGQYETVAFLLDRGANVSANALQRVEERSEWGSNCDDSGEEDGTVRVVSPLLWSLEAGHSEVAKLLIERGANTSDVRDKTTPLALEQLSGKGTLHYQKAKRGEALLISAVRRKNLDSVRWLLQQGEDVIEGDSLGDTALCCAITFIKHPEEVMEMCKLLLEFGADINVKNICSETPLLIATEFNVDNVAELLLELGCETKVKNKDSITPLLHTARHNNGKLTRILLQYGAGASLLDKDDIDRVTPLHQAVHSNSFHVIEVLLEHGVDLEVRDKSDQTPLVLAAELGRLAMVQSFAEKGSNINARDQYGKTPVILNIERIIGSGYVVSSASLKKLLDHGSSVNLTDQYGRSALHFLTQSVNDMTESCDLLLQYGADVNLPDQNSQTPLHFAASVGNTLCMEWLVQHGADMRAVDINQHTTLHAAVSFMHNGNAVDWFIAPCGYERIYTTYQGPL